VTDCTNGEIRDLLPEYAHGRLQGEHLVAVRTHVASCALCTAELALLERIRTSLAPVPAVDIHAIVARLPAPPARLQLVDSTPSRAPRRRVFFARPVVRAAAVLALVVGAGTWYFTPDAMPVIGGPAVVGAAPSEASTPSEPAMGSTGASPAVAAAAGAELATSVTADLDEAELRGLLEAIDGLESVPAAEGEEIVRGLGNAGSGEL
jgi:hypothetical protein